MSLTQCQWSNRKWYELLYYIFPLKRDNIITKKQRRVPIVWPIPYSRLTKQCIPCRYIQMWYLKGSFMSWEDYCYFALWRHQMEIFSALLALCVGNSSVTGEFSSQRPVTRSFHVSFDMRLNKRLSKHSRRRWFETPLRPLCRHCNGINFIVIMLGVEFVVSQYQIIESVKTTSI